MRRSGILLHISSLPSPYGIGTYGKEAYEFVDFLVAAKQTYWQILPLGPTSYGDSPYQTFSAFANNPYFIDLDFLVDAGLLLPEEIKATYKSASYVDYKELYKERFIVLKKAYQRFNHDEQSYIDFVQSAKWLHDYALFMAIKGRYQGQSWLYWDQELRLRDPKALQKIETELQDEIGFFKFLQFQANCQWYTLKQYANERGILIVGDMPIYVSYDSSDVWANPELFELDALRQPTYIAGVPPDNFTTDGQLWGNPLYNWNQMATDGFSWWVSRVADAVSLFDWVRIDHFIGFQNFYSIPFGDETAKNGVWKKGPGIEFFKVIFQKLGKLNIIAEDLGVVTPEVRNLLKETGYPGMKLLQFAFDPNEDSDHAPHYHHKNVVCYTGTHDNKTARQWFEELDEETLQKVTDYINHEDSHGYVDSLVKETLKSVADHAIIPLQDYLNLGSEARMNIPATVGNNWRWRVSKKDLNLTLIEKIAKFTELYGRENNSNT